MSSSILFIVALLGLRCEAWSLLGARSAVVVLNKARITTISAQWRGSRNNYDNDRRGGYYGDGGGGGGRGGRRERFGGGGRRERLGGGGDRERFGGAAAAGRERFGGGGGGHGRGGNDRKPGDWTCPACSANVFASKTSCFRCGEPKPSGRGGDSDDGSYGWDYTRGRGRQYDRGYDDDYYEDGNANYDDGYYGDDGYGYDRRRGRGGGGRGDRGGFDRHGGGGSGASTYFRREGDNAEVDVAAVEALIAERTQLRRQHDYDAADAVRDRLTEEHGVTVYDRESEWFVGGGPSRGGSSRGARESDDRSAVWSGGGRPGRGRIDDYKRDPYDEAPVDVGAVEAMLSERSRFRERRMWNEADAVRERLQAEHGVTVSDKDFEWRVDGGGGRSRYGRRSGEGRRDRASRYDEWRDDVYDDAYDDDGVGPLEVGPMPATLRVQTEYGILGHDYTRVAADSTPLSADDFEPINGLLAARLEAKRARRYGEADALLAMLLDLGVTVEDNARMWRADGVPFDPKAWTRIAGDGDLPGEVVPTGGYGAMSSNDGNAAPREATDRNAVSTSPSSSSSSSRADGLTTKTVPELREMLRAAGLKVGGKKAELIERLSGAGAEDEDEGEAEAEAEAEAVTLEGLGATSGGGGGDEVGVDEAAVVALLEERGRAKQAKDYETADEIVARLRSDYSVVVDDKRRTWRVVVEYGGYYRVGPQVDPFNTKQVGDMLARRSAHQARKEYEEADALHDALTEMGIVLDTRIKTWKRPAARAERKRNRRSTSSTSSSPSRGRW